ncbi:LytR/AlgR family response regulator transcription factor [Pseudobutyrivibrio xylanivorans]|uniref:Stage 0 sporulation protein A homolog n=1 Tax=Pseudobutyrivibrio xylanivorans DSM 14809 TaxID=1123012 RepID=A0A1M6FW14_PSEXY|nr:LytTR family DNA-binding domain-containing protein [Pseudobutyrivibrio xylanivorans]SHJ01905.1 two component transcriptional regulator, LytTR family [Pseudobutyrivibrio xylanivorans DSM 14809]
MLNIALVENDNTDAELFTDIASSYFIDAKVEFHIDIFAAGEEFLDAYQGQYQIVFMDIELDGINGMNTARKLREIDNNVILIFLTNLAHYAIAGYEVNATDYILKPLQENAFRLKMPKVLAQIQQQAKKTITVLSKGQMHTFSTDELYYVEVLSHRLYYHTLDGVYDVRGTMSDAETSLYKFDFRRCNNSYLVNLRFVTGIQGNDVKVGPHVLSISRPRKKEFINELTNYLGGQL